MFDSRVQIAPARLHHTDLRIGKEVNRPLQEIYRRNKVSVKDGNQFAGRCLQSFLKRAGLVAMPVFAVAVLNRMPRGAVLIA